MKPYFEDLSYSLLLTSGFPHQFPEHLHGQLEMTGLISGEACVTVEGKTYAMRAGDLCFCFPGVIHGYGSVENPVGWMLIADPKHFPDFSEVLEENRPRNPVVHVNDLPEDVAFCMQRLREESIQPINEPAVRGYVQVLLAKTMPKMQLAEEPVKHSDVAYQIMRYLSKHFTEPVSVADMAKALNISRSHISHTFSNRLHTNFRTYVNVLRTDLACKLLRGTDFNITRIAYECGFETQRTFNRAFQEQCGMTPKEYRGTNRPERNEIPSSKENKTEGENV